MDQAMDQRVKKPKPRRMRLSSVANAIRLTKAFSEHEYEMGISALAGRLGLAKSTVHRLATTLVEYDILEQNRESGKYRLGLALFELGTLVRRKMDAVSESRQQMSALLEMTGETVQLAVLDHQSVLYIRILESRQQVRMSSTVGARAPAHCTAVGKALLAFQPAEQVKQIVENGLRRFTANTVTEPERLLEDVVLDERRGQAMHGALGESQARGERADPHLVFVLGERLGEADRVGDAGKAHAARLGLLRSAVVGLGGHQRTAPVAAGRTAMRVAAA